MHRNMHFLANVPAIAVSAWALNFAAAGNANAIACTSITNVAQLQAMQNDVTGSYCLANDIDAGSRPNFMPIGSNSNQFTGRFDGRGFAISNLTIKRDGAGSSIGLFGATNNAVIVDVSLINVTVVALGNGGVGALVGLLDANGGASTVVRVHVSGAVRCQTGTNCFAGGILGATNGSGILRESSSSVEVTGTVQAGGAVGFLLNPTTIARTYATGPVSCTASPCIAGGLVARASLNAAVMASFATGPVVAADGNDSRAGGLIGLTESGVTISRAYAAGPVSGGGTGQVGGLIAQHNSGGNLDQTYAVGAVSSTGASTGGLVQNAGGSPIITASYWDTGTTGQMTSGAGTGLTTQQLRAELRAGFGTAWGITKKRSYPFLVIPNIDFASPLATLVRFNLVYVFLPISQLDDSQYINPPAHADKASLAAVYTMIARAVGISANVPQLRDVKIDKYFWVDATQTTRWRGPIVNYALLGNRMSIASGRPLDHSNVIGRMDTQRLVILRGTYTKDGGGTAAHWMLGTLYSTNPDDSVKAVLADDPLTGLQVTIDPVTKQVIAPAEFPLADFTVDRYQPVTLTLPVSDIRLKRDVVEVARLDNGLGLYRYRYLWSDEVYVGVMAQEVARVVPAAVALAPDGYLRVNYGILGMRLQTWEEWLAQGRHPYEFRGFLSFGEGRDTRDSCWCRQSAAHCRSIKRVPRECYNGYISSISRRARLGARDSSHELSLL